MPSTISRLDSIDFASSTVITPSLPTFSIASASILPIVASPFAEIVPTWAISAEARVDFESLPSSSTTAAPALPPPPLKARALIPPPAALASLLLEHREDVFLADDQVLLAIELDFRAGVLAEQDPVPLLHVEGGDDALLVHLAAADGDHAALHRLLLGRVGDDDPALGLGL